MTSGAEVFLHIGTMKSGTSYLQSTLRRNKQALDQAGIFVPERMVAAASDALGNKGKNRTMDTRGEWARVVSEISGWHGDRVVASHEFFGEASAEQARSVIDSLAPRKITVIITARDLARVIPSHWQTVVKSMKTWSFAEYVDIVLSDPDDQGPARRGHAGFWRHHDLARIVANWSEAVGLENVVIVTVPPSGAPPELLWNRFCEVIGIDGAAYDHEADAKSNLSLSYTETEMLRRINIAIGTQLAPPEYRAVVNNYFANQLLRTGPDNEVRDKPRLGPASHAAVAKRANEMISAVRATGVRVVGDITELDVPAYSGDPHVDETTGPEQPLPEVVPHVIAQLLIKIAHSERPPTAQASKATPDRQQRQQQRRARQRDRAGS